MIEAMFAVENLRLIFHSINETDHGSKQVSITSVIIIDVIKIEFSTIEPWISLDSTQILFCSYLFK